MTKNKGIRARALARRSARQNRRVSETPESIPKNHWRDLPRVRTLFGIGEFVGLIAVVCGVYGLGLEIEDRNDEREARALALLTPIVSTQKRALEYLGENNVELGGIDLSCEAMGGGWDEVSMICETPPFWRSLKMPNAQLEGADFSGADLSNADFDGARLSNAVLSGANFKDAVFSFAALREAKLYRAQMRHAKFIGADLFGANLAKANLNYTDFSDANLVAAIFSNADLRNANFSGSSLDNANLSNADLYGVDLTATNLVNANFSGADLRNTDFTGAVFSESTNFKNAWTWNDRLPIGLVGIEIDLCIFLDGADHTKKPETGCVPTVMK